MRLLVLVLVVAVPGCLDPQPAAQDFIFMRGSEPHGVSADCDEQARIEVTNAHADGDGFRLRLHDGAGRVVWSHDVRAPGAVDDLRAHARGEAGTWRLEAQALGEGQSQNSRAFVRLMCL